MRKVKSLFSILVVVICTLLFYNFNIDFKKTIDEKFIDNYFNRSIQNMSSSGNEERIELFKLGLREGNGFGFGRGIGAIPFNGDSYVKHFALNDL